MKNRHTAEEILEHFQVIYDRLVRSEIAIQTTNSDDAPWLCDRFPFESDLEAVRCAVGEFVNHLAQNLNLESATPTNTGRCSRCASTTCTICPWCDEPECAWCGCMEDSEPCDDCDAPLQWDEDRMTYTHPSPSDCWKATQMPTYQVQP